MQSYCKNCGTKNDFFKLESNGPSMNHVLVCSGCRAWTVDPDVQIELETIYSRDYFNGAEYLSYEFSQKSQIKNFKKKLKILKKKLGLAENDFQNIPILEIGCATGVFLDLLKENGFRNILGVEISSYAREIASKKGHRVISPNDPGYLDSIKDFRASIICAWDVWEHLENPASIFDQIIQVSAPTAAIAVTTVDSGRFFPKIRKTKWRQFHPPSHLNYPNAKSFQIYFEKRDFHLLHQKSFGMYRPLIEYVGALTKIKNESIEKLPSIFQLPIYLNLFDIQFVLARKGSNFEI